MSLAPVTVIGPRDHAPEGADVEVVNTTSRSDDFGRDLSPFLLGPVLLYPPYYSMCVENGWQFSKVYAEHWDAAHQQPTEAWGCWARAGWASRRARRYPMGKGVEPICSWWRGCKLGYIDARKEIFLPLYVACTILRDSYRKLQDMRAAGKHLVLWDFDGYDHRKLGMTYNDVLHDEGRIMGHAFILAMLLEGAIT